MSYKSLEDISMYPEKDKGFEIKCKNCGSTDCTIDILGDYDHEEEWYSWDTWRITCNSCGQET